jgi:hypothetical protein
MWGRAVTSLFVPATEYQVAGKTPEELHATLAKACGVPVPAANRRISSMIFVHDGIEYTSTVGRRLQGVNTRARKSRGREFYDRVPDGPIVVAIFAGSPYMVWLDAKPLSSQSTGGWMNPFMATNDPRNATYFDV